MCKVNILECNNNLQDRCIATVRVMTQRLPSNLGEEKAFRSSDSCSPHFAYDQPEWALSDQRIEFRTLKLKHKVPYDSTRAIMLADSPEAKELNLIGKVELRIALTESDAKLQSTLGTYLTPLLLKLGSEHVSVRNKVRIVLPLDSNSSCGPALNTVAIVACSCVVDVMLKWRRLIRSPQVITVCQHINTRVKPPYVLSILSSLRFSLALLSFSI